MPQLVEQESTAEEPAVLLHNHADVPPDPQRMHRTRVWQTADLEPNREFLEIHPESQERLSDRRQAAPGGEFLVGDRRSSDNRTVKLLRRQPFAAAGG